MPRQLSELGQLIYQLTNDAIYTQNLDLLYHFVGNHTFLCSDLLQLGFCETTARNLTNRLLKNKIILHVNDPKLSVYLDKNQQDSCLKWSEKVTSKIPVDSKFVSRTSGNTCKHTPIEDREVNNLFSIIHKLTGRRWHTKRLLKAFELTKGYVFTSSYLQTKGLNALSMRPVYHDLLKDNILHEVPRSQIPEMVKPISKQRFFKWSPEVLRYFNVKNPSLLNNGRLKLNDLKVDENSLYVTEENLKQLTRQCNVIRQMFNYTAPTNPSKRHVFTSTDFLAIGLPQKKALNILSRLTRQGATLEVQPSHDEVRHHQHHSRYFKWTRGFLLLAGKPKATKHITSGETVNRSTPNHSNKSKLEVALIELFDFYSSSPFLTTIYNLTANHVFSANDLNTIGINPSTGRGILKKLAACNAVIPEEHTSDSFTPPQNTPSYYRWNENIIRRIKPHTPIHVKTGKEVTFETQRLTHGPLTQYVANALKKTFRTDVFSDFYEVTQGYAFSASDFNEIFSVRKTKHLIRDLLDAEIIVEATLKKTSSRRKYYQWDSKVLTMLNLKHSNELKPVSADNNRQSIQIKTFKSSEYIQAMYALTYNNVFTPTDFKLIGINSGAAAEITRRCIVRGLIKKAKRPSHLQGRALQEKSTFYKWTKHFKDLVGKPESKPICLRTGKVVEFRPQDLYLTSPVEKALYDLTSRNFNYDKLPDIYHFTGRNPFCAADLKFIGIDPYSASKVLKALTKTKALNILTNYHPSYKVSNPHKRTWLQWSEEMLSAIPPQGYAKHIRTQETVSFNSVMQPQTSKFLNHLNNLTELGTEDKRIEEIFKRTHDQVFYGTALTNKKLSRSTVLRILSALFKNGAIEKIEKSALPFTTDAKSAGEYYVWTAELLSLCKKKGPVVTRDTEGRIVSIDKYSTKLLPAKPSSPADTIKALINKHKHVRNMYNYSRDVVFSASDFTKLGLAPSTISRVLKKLISHNAITFAESKNAVYVNKHLNKKTYYQWTDEAKSTLGKKKDAIHIATGSVVTFRHHSVNIHDEVLDAIFKATGHVLENRHIKKLFYYFQEHSFTEKDCLEIIPSKTSVKTCINNLLASGALIQQDTINTINNARKIAKKKQYTFSEKIVELMSNSLTTYNGQRFNPSDEVREPPTIKIIDNFNESELTTVETCKTKEAKEQSSILKKLSELSSKKIENTIIHRIYMRTYNRAFTLNDLERRHIDKNEACRAIEQLQAEGFIYRTHNLNGESESTYQWDERVRAKIGNIITLPSGIEVDLNSMVVNF